MEALTRLVSESLARHGFDRPLDYRRLHWSRWFRCESHHSLLLVPSKPGVFAVAEEILSDIGTASPAQAYAGTAALGRGDAFEEERPFRAASADQNKKAALAADSIWAEVESRKPEAPRRMLAVTQFFESDDMAFVLDRMLARINPMQALLTSGRYFVRFVVIEDESQRRSICNALNQWIASTIANTAEVVSPIGSHFAASLELTPANEYVPAAHADQPSLFETSVTATSATRTLRSTASPNPLADPGKAGAPHLDCGASANLHCPSPLPSGF